MSAPLYLARAGFGRNQLFRTALALAALRGQSLKMSGLVSEGPRPHPGLGAGHTTAAAAAAAITGGEFSLSEDGVELKFSPGGPPQAGDWSFNVAHERPSPAGFSLVLEVLLPPLCAAGGPSHLILSGGTHVPGCATSDEIGKVLAPTWRSLGLDVSFMEVTPGFLPNGAGEAEVSIRPFPAVKPLQADSPFKALRLGVEVVTCGLPTHLAEQVMDGVRDRLALHRLKAKASMRKAQGRAGMALLVWAEGQGYRVGFSSLGKRGGRPEALANQSCEALVNFLQSGAGLPSLMAARLLPLLVLSKGVSNFTVDRLTQPLKAAVQAMEALMPGAVRLNQPRQGALLEIRVQGRGLMQG